MSATPPDNFLVFKSSCSSTMEPQWPDLPEGWQWAIKTVILYEWRCARGGLCGKHKKLLYKKKTETKLFVQAHGTFLTKISTQIQCFLGMKHVKPVTKISPKLKKSLISLQRSYRCVGLCARAVIELLCRCVCAGVFRNSDRIAVLACAVAAIVSLCRCVQ